jgi:NO-binding membrane sensor protein with MHYT domain
MLGFDVPESMVRYDIAITALSLALAVAIVAVGLCVVGLGRPSTGKIVVGGACTGLGVAAMHYTGMSAMRVSGGRIFYEPQRVALSVAIAVVAATVALWFAVVIRGAGATVGAAIVMALAICGMHYTGMSAVRIELIESSAPAQGTSPVVLLAPIFVLACVVISTLAYCTVGISIERDTARDEASLRV